MTETQEIKDLKATLDLTIREKLLLKQEILDLCKRITELEATLRKSQAARPTPDFVPEPLNTRDDVHRF